MMAWTGHKYGSPEQARPITSPRTPFFCVVKVKEAKRARRSSHSGAARMGRRVSPMKSWTFSSRNGSPSLSVYSPGRSRKKKAKMIMSEAA